MYRGLEGEEKEIKLELSDAIIPEYQASLLYHICMIYRYIYLCIDIYIYIYILYLNTLGFTKIYT